MYRNSSWNRAENSDFSSFSFVACFINECAFIPAVLPDITMICNNISKEEGRVLRSFAVAVFLCPQCFLAGVFCHFLWFFKRNISPPQRRMEWWNTVGKRWDLLSRPVVVWCCWCCWDRSSPVKNGKRNWVKKSCNVCSLQIRKTGTRENWLRDENFSIPSTSRTERLNVFLYIVGK